MLIEIQSSDNAFTIVNRGQEMETRPKLYECVQQKQGDETLVEVRQVHTKETLFYAVPIDQISVNGTVYGTYEELSSVLTPILFNKGGGSGGGAVSGDFIPLSGTEVGKPAGKIKQKDEILLTDYTEKDLIPKKYADLQHSYSTTETKTGGTWIDGKPIYKKYITVDIPANNPNPVGYVITNTVVIDFEKAYLKTLESNYAHAHGKGDNSIYDWSFSKDVTNGQLLVAPKTAHTTIRTVSGVLFYTKTTD